MKTKYCGWCGTEKPIGSFGKSRERLDGLSFYCRSCRNAKQRAFIKTPAGKEIAKRARQKESNKENQRKRAAILRTKEKYREIKRRYQQSAKGRATARAYQGKIRKTPERLARDFLNHKIEEGKFPRAKTVGCSVGGECYGRIEYHHHKGYERKNWMEVVAMCRKHHVISEGKPFRDKRTGHLSYS